MVIVLPKNARPAGRCEGSSHPAGPASAEPAADKPGDGLAQRLVGIPGYRDRLSVKILREVR